MGYTLEDIKELHRNATPEMRRQLESQIPELAPKAAPTPAKPVGPSPMCQAAVTQLLLTVTLPIRLQTESNTHGHWAPKAARAKAQRAAVRANLGRWASVLTAALPARVLITRLSPRGKPLDSDNLASSAKHVRDEIAAIMGVDDGDRRVDWQTAQRRGAIGVEITIQKQAV